MIRTRGLSYRYATGGTAPLRFPDVDLRQGGTLLLRGRSGSGKSTWLSLIAGLRGASGGDLFVAGTQLGTQRGAEMDAWRARSIGFLPQKLHLSSALTVADNLVLVYFAAGLPRDDAAITRALAQVGVAELAARKPHQLSGGQAQRVALARAVLLAPQGEEGAAPRFECDDCHRQFRLSQGSAKVQKALQQVLQALATAGHESLAVDVAVHGRCVDCAHPAEGAAA